MGGVRRFVEDLLGDRRPRRFRVRDEDQAAELRAAIALRAAGPAGDEGPGEEFTAGLQQRLAAQLEAEPVEAAHPTRRRFVQAAGIAAAGVAVGGVVDHLLIGPAGVAPAAAPEDTGTLMPNTGVWRPVVASAELPEGGVHAFDVGTLVGFVERTGGRLRAVSGVCTHQGCRLALEPAARELACPCHRTVFALAGTVVRSQLRTPPAVLPRLPVREVDGSIQVYAPPTPT
ncbi:MAG TPA: Rieske (2Fe-2S) protein [Mycobacteriales bacterium]|jgi:nitrite reductase/ring-hydroxylating ferredoxin subunit|nr:Rieske (2Fe-2S) protein [Mycobacteriales bacterium]